MAKQIDPQDQAEFNAQVRAEPHLYVAIAEALDPKVRIENNIFPFPHETYNCTTCRYGGPNISSDKERFYNRCSNHRAVTFGRWCEGRRWNDIECPSFESKEKRVML